MYSLLTSIFLIGTTCCFYGPYRPELSSIESIIQTDPSTALKELRELDTVKLNNKDQALYSLLLSMALDKNYIDVKVDSLITPAVDYYSRSTDKKRKFLAYYYLGRVQENAEDYDEALTTYIEASKVPEKHIPLDYRIRLHTRKGVVYYHQFALDRALSESYRAKELAIDSDNPEFYIYGCIDVAAMLISMNKPEQAYEELESSLQWMKERGISPPATFRNLWLRVLLSCQRDDIETLKVAFQEYVTTCQQQRKQVSALLCADYYMAIDKPEAAAEELARLEPEVNSLDTFSYILYYIKLAAIQKRFGNYRKALSSVETYNNKLQELNIKIHNNDVRFLEERAKAEQEKANAKHRATVLLFISVFAICALGASVISLINKQKQFNREIEKAKSEYDFLKSIAAVGEQYPEDLRQAISDRLQALRPYIIPGKRFFSAERNNILKETNDKRQEMLGNIGLIYALSFPGFVSKLNGYHLNAQEIGLCCMYLSGYSAKELSGRKNANLAYQENTIIRQKLGIGPNGVKLSTRLRDIFNESVPKG